MRYMGKCIGAVFILLTTTINGAEPPAGFERALQPGGRLALDSIPQDVWDGRGQRIAAASIRKIYDAAGLPADDSTAVRSPAEGLRWGVSRIKRALVAQDIRISWERWTIRIAGRPGVQWAASLRGLPGTRLPAPFQGCPTHQYHNWNGSPELTRLVGETPPRPPLTTEQQRHTLFCQEHFLHRLHTTPVGLFPSVIDNPGSIPAPGPGIISWSLHRDAGGKIEPRVTLAQLEQLAPFFYEAIPAYLHERAAWFDHWDVQTLSIFADDPDGPHMLEIQGAFAFENKEHGFQFDDHFDPGVFRRIHCRAWEDADLNSLRPSRKTDVVVIHDPRGSHRLRFLIDARYDPQPELRGKALWR